MSIEPRHHDTRLMLTLSRVGETLRARLPLVPHQPRALAMLLEALSAWYGTSLTAVIDAAAEDVQLDSEKWRRLLAEVDGEQVRVQWVVVPTAAERNRFLGAVDGDFRPSGRLVNFAATGRRR
jgi:hypothetical protein